jgi:hypothetical protein
MLSTAPWRGARRPQAAALVAQLADPGRGWDAIVIGEYERAFYGSQYAAIAELVDPRNVTLGHKRVQRWNQPDGLVISNRPAHPPLISEADFITAQDVNATRGPAPQAGPVLRWYLLAGLLACGVCERRMESAWSSGKPAYRCRHGRTSAMTPDPGWPKNRRIRT